MIYIPKQTILIGIGTLLLLFAAGTIAIARHHTLGVDTKTTASTKKNTTDTSTTPTNSTTKTIPAGSATKAVSTDTTSDTTPSTTACKLLSPDVAKQIIGNNAKLSISSDTSKLQTADTVVSACAYSNGTITVQLVVRTPKNSLGVSENSTAFGSEKPTNALTTSGYGQASYWDPAKQRLNVLGSNSWYIITRSTNTQADAETTAKLLAPGF